MPAGPFALRLRRHAPVGTTARYAARLCVIEDSEGVRLERGAEPVPMGNWLIDLRCVECVCAASFTQGLLIGS